MHCNGCAGDSLCTYPQLNETRKISKSLLTKGKSRIGWGGRIRTYDWLIQNYLPYQCPPTTAVLISVAMTDTANPAYCID
jgi:hypothetical protein